MQLIQGSRITIFSLALFLAVSFPAGAGEIPFDTGDEITALFDRGRTVVGTDIDGDGDLDLLTAGPDQQNEVAWWENTNGDGSDWAKRSIDDALPNAAAAWAVDLDKDGDTDVLAAALGGGGVGGASQVVFYENADGVGTSWSKITIADTDIGGADAVTAADIDLDGDLDVVAGGMNTKNLTWFDNTNGDGSAWTARDISSFFNGVRTVETVDFDKDGDPDVVASGEFEDEVAWFENPGPDMVTSVAFWTRNVVSPTPLDGAAGGCPVDFDHDGDLDVGSLADGSGANPEKVVWYENGGDNVTFTEHVVEAAYGRAHGLYCADVDADGDVDLLAAGRSEEPSPFGALTWWENRLALGGDWVRHDIDPGFAGARGIWFGDLDGDGFGDAVGIGDNDKVIWYSNLSTHRNASFTPVPVDVSFTGAQDVAVADVDCDRDGDIIAGGGDAVSWWAQEADGSWTETAVSSTFLGASGVASGDLDADGDLDIVGAADSDDDIAWFQNTVGDGSAWTEQTVDGSFNGARAVDVGDLDQDGTLDIVAAAFDDGTFSWWSNDAGDGLSWTETVIATGRNGAVDVHVVDLDGDGDLDVIAAAETDDDVFFLENTDGAGGTWAVITIDGSSDGIRAVAAGDIDGDSDLDVVGVNSAADTVVWWANTSASGDGSSWSAAQPIDNSHNGASGVAVADFDGDGDLDVVASQSEDGGKVTWYENTDDFVNPWAEEDLTTLFDGGAGVAVGDLDHNSQVDVVAAAETAGDVTYFPNRGGQFALAGTNTAPLAFGNSETDDVLRILAVHNGLLGEEDLELTSFELLFEEVPGDPLDDTEINSIIENVFIYLDNGSNAWEMGADTLVATVDMPTLDNGVLTVPFADGDVNVQLSPGGAANYFVVLETTATYDSAGLTFFQVTHLTESGKATEATSGAENRFHDTPLLLEWAENVSSNLFEVNTGPTSADLVVSAITDSPDPVDVGGEVTYTVTVQNNGPWPALNVRVTSVLPANTTFQSTFGCNEDPNGFPTCTLGSLASGASDSFDITLDVGAGALGTTLTYEATVASDTTEESPGDETATEDTEVTSEADLSLFTQALPPTYADGFGLTFEVRVTNLGSGAAVSPTVSSTLPAALTDRTWTCVGRNGGVCPAASGTGDLSAESVTLPGGAEVIFYTRGEVPVSTSGTLSNSASVSSSNDPDTGNNSDSASADHADHIFVDDFESGDFDDWSSVVP